MEVQALFKDQHLGPLGRHWQVLDAAEADSNLKQAANWGGQVGEAVIQDAYWMLALTGFVITSTNSRAIRYHPDQGQT